MAKADSSTSKTYLEYRRGESQQYVRERREERVREALKAGAAALSATDPDYAALAAVLAEDLLPELVGDDGRALRHYDRQIEDDPEWDAGALGWIIDHRRRLGPEGLVDLYVGDPTSGEVDRLVSAFRACGAIASEEGIVDDELESRVDAVGRASKIGEHIQSYQMDLGGPPVGLLSEASGAVKTLFTGGTGQGKSTGLETEAEDYYRQTFREGRDYKLVDLMGFRDGENWFYDVRQQDQSLRRVREEMDLPPDFTDEDRPNPQMEILVPMTPGLRSRDLPYRTEDDDGEFVIRPFTVPASEIRKPLLISMISARLSDQQEQVVRAAYDDLDHRRDDWTLADLADEIRNRNELKPTDKRPVVRTLKHLQQQGFVRNHSSEYTIDWPSIFTEPETITVFSQAFMDSVVGKLVSFGYLADTLVKTRETMHGVPQTVVLIRELWKIAPHRQRRSFSGRAAGLQNAIGTMLAELFRENRHSGLHVLADTQKLSDLVKPVREMFNRYVVFRTDRDTVEEIFDYTANDRSHQFYDTLSPTPGMASVVGMVEPALSEQRIEFVGPVEYAPPAHHHRRADIDHTGWTAREKLLDDEELHTPAEMGVTWPDEVPDRLRIDTSVSDDTVDVHEAPVAAFAEECLVQKPGGEPKYRVYEAFNEFVQDHGKPLWDLDDRTVRQRFGQQLNDCLEPKPKNTRKNGSQAYQNYKLNRVGERYLRAAQEETDDQEGD